MALLGPVESGLANEPSSGLGVSYAFTYYSEDSLPADKLEAGATSRYEIETHQVSFSGPVAEKVDVGFDFIYETMSGATPFFVVPGPDADHPMQVMSGATVSEERFDGNLSSNYYLDSSRVGANLGISKENDYFSVYSGVNGERDFNEKNTTLSSGIGFSIDKIEPTDSAGSNRVSSAHKRSMDLFGGVSQILNRSTTVQSTMSYKYSKGFLSDPYKLACIQNPATGNCGTNVNDNRPGDRNQFAWLTKLRYHVEAIDATIQADYRFHHDDWKVTSHTFEAKWYQNFLDGKIQVIPSFRYYSQSQAYFYEPFYASARSDGLASSDYRLSPYGAISYGARVQAEIEDWPWGLDLRLGLFYERYMADAGLALSKVAVPNPGLVDFHLIYCTLDLRFR